RFHHCYRRRSCEPAGRADRRSDDRRIGGSGRHRAVAVDQEFFQLSLADPGAAAAPGRTVRQTADRPMIPWTQKQQWIAACVFVALLAALPAAVNEFHLSVLATIFLTAVVGIAWNLMMGYAGQLSLGHALYFGVGAYVLAIATERYGVSPWLAMIPAAL